MKTTDKFVIYQQKKISTKTTPIQKRNRILSFYNTISVDVINFIDSEAELDATIVMDFINERIEANNIDGLKIYLLE
jgi:hypothetical protein